MNMYRARQVSLINTGVGLSIIGLGYGIDPNFYPSLYGYALTTVNEVHIFRALCTLYLTLGGYWIYTALRKPQWHEGALISVMVVMFGLFSGRLLSVLFDGMPHWLLFFYMMLEMAVFAQTWFIWRKSQFSES